MSGEAGAGAGAAAAAGVGHAARELVRDPLRPQVWAPDASDVALVREGADRPMERGEDGWWRAPDRLEPGDDYRFRVDGQGPFPDPRSRHQPEGVHGPSRAIDPGAWEWTDGSWRGFHLPSAVVYELHPGTFTPGGTLDTAIERLDHLVDLGVDAVELMPVAAFPGEHGWGYDGVALWAVHEPYGGPEAMHRFVDACHARGLGVLLDVVYNHLGPDGNYLGQYGPYFTDHYDTPWGAAVNFDRGGSRGVRDFVIGNALMWMRDYHVDGLRLDAVHAIVDTSATHVLEEMAEAARVLSAQVGRPLWLVAESDLNDPRLVRSTEAGGYGLDAQWSDDFHHALHAALTGERAGYYGDFGGLAPVARALEHAFVYAGQRSDYRDRPHGRSADGLPGSRFFGYVQNHDQVGNRAVGDRLSQSLEPGLLEVAAAVVLTSPFVPMLFQGEEWAASTPFQYFTDHQDPDLGRAVREGRRGEFAAFGWDPEEVPDPQDPETFERSRLRWEERGEGVHRRLLDWHRALLRLRRREPALRDGRLDRVRARADEAAGTLVVRRGVGGHSPVVATLCNFSDEERTVRASPGRVLVRSGSGGATDPTGPDEAADRETRQPSSSPVDWTLPPRSVLVLREDRPG